MTFKNLKYFSFGQQVGYATAAMSYLENLIAIEDHISWETIIQGQDTKKGIEPKFLANVPAKLKSILNPTESGEIPSHQIIHLTPEHFPVLCNPKAQNIGMTVWETNKLPFEWKNHLNKLDKVIVPCQWNADVFTEAKIKPPVFKLPHISQFHGEHSSFEMDGIPKDSFVFFNVSVWENRKNLNELLEAYFKAFSGNKDVILILKTSKRDESGPFIKFGNYQKHIKTRTRLNLLRLKYKAFSPKVLLINKEVSTEYMKALYSRADAYVSLAHAEGWGMGLYECAWYGKPVIATNYSGYLDFLKSDNSYLIDYKLVDVKKNAWESKDLKGHQWASPNLDHAISNMREVYKNWEIAKEKGRILKNYVEHNFSPVKITQDLLKIINI
jgi:glycosyltransferase involved in cell wall biosynthesis